MRVVLRFFQTMFVLYIVTGCRSEVEAVIEGERLSVLEFEQSLEVDPSLPLEPRPLPDPIVNPSWPEVGGSATTLTGHLSLSPTPQQIWQASAPTGSDSTQRVISTPISVEETLFVFDAGTNLVAFNRQTGQYLWELNLQPENEDGEALGGGMAYSQNHLYVTTGYAELIALDLQTRMILWRRSLPTPPRGAPTVDGERIFVMTIDNRTIALRRDDGMILWDHIGLVAELGFLKAVSPVTDGDIVVSAYSSGELVALSADNGQVIWDDSLVTIQRVGSLRAITDINSQPIIDEDLVITSSHSGLLVAINYRQGTRVWQQDISSINTPWVADQTIFVLTSKSEIAALTRDEGRVKWVRQLQLYHDEEDQDLRIIWNGPVLAGGVFMA